MRMFTTLITIILVPFFCEAQNNNALIQAHINKFINSEKYTLEVASEMPDSLYNFRPVSTEMSFKQQLIHLGKNIIWLCTKYLNEQPNLPSFSNNLVAEEMNKDQTINFVKKAYEYGITSFKHLDTASLMKKFDWSGTQLNKIQFLNLIEDHQTHHRAELLVYLRLNNIKPPEYIGW
ncbi:hypothetical protein FACS189444_0610 [Spirochaetia bacterium]|nr:hypothetical protein FACS189444_0610 [Spirochaetia bacterium]